MSVPGPIRTAQAAGATVLATVAAAFAGCDDEQTFNQTPRGVAETYIEARQAADGALVCSMETPAQRHTLPGEPTCEELRSDPRSGRAFEEAEVFSVREAGDEATVRIELFTRKGNTTWSVTAMVGMRDGRWLIDKSYEETGSPARTPPSDGFGPALQPASASPSEVGEAVAAYATVRASRDGRKTCALMTPRVREMVGNFSASRCAREIEVDSGAGAYDDIEITISDERSHQATARIEFTREERADEVLLLIPLRSGWHINSIAYQPPAAP